jgi:hypothetical protein
MSLPTGAPLLGRLLALSANIREGLKGLSGTKTFINYGRKSFETLVPGVESHCLHSFDQLQDQVFAERIFGLKIGFRVQTRERILPRWFVHGQTLTYRTKPGPSFQLQRWACIYILEFHTHLQDSLLPPLVFPDLTHELFSGDFMKLHYYLQKLIIFVNFC